MVVKLKEGQKNFEDFGNNYKFVQNLAEIQKILKS